MIKLKPRSNGASVMVYGDYLLKTHAAGGTSMDLGVKLIYLILCSQNEWDSDRQIHVNVVRNIYSDLIKVSPLFAYLDKSGVDADDVMRMLKYAHQTR